MKTKVFCGLYHGIKHFGQVFTQYIHGYWTILMIIMYHSSCEMAWWPSVLVNMMVVVEWYELRVVHPQICRAWHYHLPSCPMAWRCKPRAHKLSSFDWASNYSCQAHVYFPSGIHHLIYYTFWPWISGSNFEVAESEKWVVRLIWNERDMNQ